MNETKTSVKPVFSAISLQSSSYKNKNYSHSSNNNNNNHFHHHHHQNLTASKNDEITNFMSQSGPVVAMVLEKDNAVKDFRTLIGSTNPAEAAEGTIRK